MSARVEAAAEALVDGMRGKSIYATAQAALAAADAVMFNALEELVATWDNECTYCEPGDQIAQGKGIAADELRAVIAALKGGHA